MYDGLLFRIQRKFVSSTRGQVITLEAITGAVILVLMLLVAIQATVITPLSASTANQQIEEQNRDIANDILDTAAEKNAITPVILSWDEDKNQFAGAEDTDQSYYTDGVPANDPQFEFGEILKSTFSSENIAYNIDLQYQHDGEMNETTMVYQGEPSYNAVTATKTIFLHTSTIENSNSDTFIPDISKDSQLYNVVRIKITVWRM